MDKALEQQLSACRTLPSPPAIALKALEMARTTDYGAADVSRVISQDPALTAKVLSIANSPLYAMRRKAENLRQALTYLGLDATITLILSFSLAKSLINQKLNSMDHNAFWRRSLLCATVSRVLGQQQGLEDPEKLFLAGLLQDIGMLALNEIAPERYGVIYHSANSHDQLRDFERREFGIDHTDVGAWLLEQWKLPEFYPTAIKHSHCTFPSSDLPNAQYYRCLALSGLIADFWELDDRTAVMNSLAGLFLQQLGISLDELQELIQQINDTLPELSNLFELQMGEPLDPIQLINTAKELLMTRNLDLLHEIAQYQAKIEQNQNDQVQLEQRLRLDSLSGLYNRYHLDQMAQKEFQAALEQGSPLSVTFIDLDYFKQINDTYGHSIGDQTIKAMGALLQRNARNTDIVGRYGGEEFMVILPGEHHEAGLALAQRIQQALNQTPLLTTDTAAIQVTASIGIATFPSKHHSIQMCEDLVALADKCMYRSKELGRNRITVAQ